MADVAPFVLSGTGDEATGAKEGVDAIAYGLPDLTADGSASIVCTEVFAVVERICRSKFTKCDRGADAAVPPFHEESVKVCLYGKFKNEDAETAVGEDELEDAHLSS